MKNVLTLLFLAFCGVAHTQIIDFPDAKFKDALVNTLCVDTNGDGTDDEDADLNNDGEIDVNEALNIRRLNVSSKLISNLTSIENFKYLEVLNCSKNQIKSLNVQGLTNLSDLNCVNNNLTSLNVQDLTNLISLFCSGNQLTYLNVQGLSNLDQLLCGYNQITSLDVQGLTNLSVLNCANTNLTFLNVQGLTNLKSLNCSTNQLTSLNVQGLTNLKSLNCSTNQLTSLNLQGLTNLTGLSCYLNRLISLDLQGLTNLTYLSCNSNKLTYLNVQGLSNLDQLFCIGNLLSTIEVNGLKNLKRFECDNNKIGILDVQGLTNLRNLRCSRNQLTSLNLQGSTNLAELNCNINRLTSLNVQGLTMLEGLNCDENQLTYLNIKGARLNQKLSFAKNPDLNYICCDEKNIFLVKYKANTNGQICEVNSYCTFTPGGKFYLIKGKNIVDFNNNGCDDQDEKIPNIKYNITNGNNSGTFVTNSTGNYSIPVQAGTHTITPILEHPSHFEVTPTSYNVTFPSTSDTITQDFCITPKGIFRQTNITVIPLTPPARPGLDALYKIVWENVGNQIESGTLNFTYDETLLDYISATQTADQLADGIVKWNFSNLLPFEKREITVTLKVNRPTDSPAVNAGVKLYLTASILNNIFILENTVVGSYDPNDKTCLQGDRVKPDMVGEYVDYLIRFENTGNYAAENVVVKDIIDTKTFDVSTLKITDASHEVYTRIEGNKVEFIFENIQLPFDDANNDGYIAFKIKTLPSLVLGDSLKNLADIYFDYNFPIRTNEAQTTVAFPVFTKDITTEVNIYPNPVTDILYLDTNDHWTKAEIYDISGRIMRSVNLHSSSLDVSALESGTYFIRLKDGDKVGFVKFVKI